MQLLFLQNVVYAESSIITDTPKEEPNPYLSYLAIAFGLSMAVVASLMWWFTEGAASVPEYYDLTFTNDISVPVQNHAIDLFQSTLSIVTTTKNIDTFHGTGFIYAWFLT